MDQLFLIQRYWGSDDDEKDNNEKNSFNAEKNATSKKKQKLDASLIDLDSDDDCIVVNKKPKLDSCSKIINESSIIDIYDVSVIKEKKCSSINGNVLDRSGDSSIPKKSKKRKLKESKLQQDNIIRNTDYSTENVESNKHNSFEMADDDNNNELLSKKEKKCLRYFELEKNNESINKDKVTASDLEETFNNQNNVKSKKVRKMKSKQHKINDNVVVDISCQDSDNESNSNKKGKEILQYLDCEEIDNQDVSVGHDQLREKVNDSFTQENKKLTAKKVKKSKLKQEEINDSVVDISGDNPDNEINSNKKKKQKLRYFNVEEIDNQTTSTEQDQMDDKLNDSFIQKDKKVKENSSHKTVDTTNKKMKSKSLKKFKQEETDETNLDTSLGETKNDESFPTIGQVYRQKDEIIKHTLPHWLSNPTYISVNLQEKEIPISELNYLDHNTQINLIKSGVKFLFPVQSAVIPWLMQNNKQSLFLRPSDICVSAPTGSGKTLAFVLPIVQSLKDRVVSAVRALVVLPVSELAIQVHKVFETYVQGTDLKVALLIGKKSFIAEQNSLVKSASHSLVSFVDIVVATPGRILDHIYRTKGFCLKRLRYLVIDEADRMMDEIQQGWLKQVENAVFQNKCISPICVCSSYKRTFYEPTSAYNFGFISQPLQKLLYSATLTHDPEQLHSLSLYKPKLFTASPVCPEKESKGLCVVPSELKMLQVICEGGVKPMVICHFMKHHNFKKVLCFTETVERAHRLHLVLEEMGIFQVREISSFNRPVQRKIVLEQFSSGKIDILVCSDLVARGIDIENIDCVISYDVPQLVKNYIHRIGRTARAGKSGTALALLSESEVPQFRKMLNGATIKLPEEIHVSPEDLKPLVKSFQDALSVVDAKLKKEMLQRPGKSCRKSKKKHK